MDKIARIGIEQFKDQIMTDAFIRKKSVAISDSCKYDTYEMNECNVHEIIDRLHSREIDTVCLYFNMTILYKTTSRVICNIDSEYTEMIYEIEKSGIQVLYYVPYLGMAHMVQNIASISDILKRNYSCYRHIKKFPELSIYKGIDQMHAIIDCKAFHEMVAVRDGISRKTIHVHCGIKQCKTTWDAESDNIICNTDETNIARIITELINGGWFITNTNQRDREITLRIKDCNVSSIISRIILETNNK